MIGSGMVESDMKRFNNHLTCCCYSAILWLEGHLFDADASNNAVSVFIVFYDFASDCTTVMQGRKFSFLHKGLHCKNDWTKLIPILASSVGGFLNIIAATRQPSRKACSRKTSNTSNLP
jgi:hypothetical protein